MRAVEVETSGWAFVCRSAVFANTGLSRMLVFVMTQVLDLLTSFVPAIHSHCCPAELEWQQGKHDDREPTAHLVSLAVAEFAEDSWGDQCDCITDGRRSRKRPSPLETTVVMVSVCLQNHHDSSQSGACFTVADPLPTRRVKPSLSLAPCGTGSR